MKSKPLFAGMLTTLSFLVIAPVTAHADRTNAPAQPARINTLVVAAQKDGCTNPPYPGVTVRDAREGKVKMRFTVDLQGKAKDVEIVRSSGSSWVDNASVNALRECSFPRPDRQAAGTTWQEVDYVWSRE